MNSWPERMSPMSSVPMDSTTAVTSGCRAMMRYAAAESASVSSIRTPGGSSILSAAQPPSLSGTNDLGMCPWPGVDSAETKADAESDVKRIRVDQSEILKIQLDE